VKWFRSVRVPLLIAVAIVLALPLEAEAQGWKWIRKLSGPAFTKAVNGRVAVCVFGGSCGEIGVGGFRIGTPTPKAKTQGQIGVVFTYGWDGKNPDAEISGVNMLTIEDQFAVLPPWPDYVPRVFSIGVGFHRFSGNGIEGSFWRTSLVQTIMWRVKLFHSHDSAGKVIDSSWFVEGGPEFTYFFSGLKSEDFGGIPEVGVVEGGEMGFSLFFRVGYRFMR